MTPVGFEGELRIKNLVFGVNVFFQHIRRHLKTSGGAGWEDDRPASCGLDHFGVTDPIGRLENNFLTIVTEDLDNVKQ